MWLGDAIDVLSPLVGALSVHMAVRLLAENTSLPASVREGLRQFSAQHGEAILEDAQRRFFDNPGLDTLLVQALARVWRIPVGLGRAYLHSKILLGLDHTGSARESLGLVPKHDFEALMASYLAIGTALGWFRGGPVSVNLWYRDGEFYELPGEEPDILPSRLEAPRSISDMAADIDDLYWVEAEGQPVKITRVGEGQRRRWLISLPGTDHMDPNSTRNPADPETNTREVLGLDSAMRQGVVAALRHAMASEGVSERDMPCEPVVVMGHSQGGMVALSLADRYPREVNVRAVITLGTPGRRLRVSRDVAALAVEHDQDVVPSMDGRPRRGTNDRVVVGRHLIRPRTGALFYAHSSSTYTETIGLIERRARISPESRIGRVFARIEPYMAREGEPASVYIYEVVQELLDGTAPRLLDTMEMFAQMPVGVFPPVPGWDKTVTRSAKEPGVMAKWTKRNVAREER